MDEIYLKTVMIENFMGNKVIINYNQIILKMVMIKKSRNIRGVTITKYIVLH